MGGYYVKLRTIWLQTDVSNVLDLTTDLVIALERKAALSVQEAKS
jgi:hypothetical protein